MVFPGCKVLLILKRVFVLLLLPLFRCITFEESLQPSNSLKSLDHMAGC
jgi:hypothetical protein